MNKTRAQATQEIYDLQKETEARPMAIATIYKKLKRLPDGSWHLSGRGYSYTA